ncbi:MAG: Ig-like domain-containing protein, partial [Actinobacteria bacterium]|nr:Ig-like domain-containing protein [Actinomycetota bacterium]
MRILPPPGATPTYDLDNKLINPNNDSGQFTLGINAKRVDVDFGLDVEPPGTVKVCKVAGPGVAPGTLFTITVGSTNLSVPAGSCVVGPTFPVGLNVPFHEVIPTGSGITVDSIVVDPPAKVVGTPDLANGNATVTIGNGINEVTFTNKKTGFLEICKQGSGPLSGSFTFYVNPGNLGPFVVPVGACSPRIEVAVGTATISENLTPGSVMVGCNTLPSNSQGPCSTGAQTSTVNVVAGGVSSQTIAYVTNRSTTTLTDTHTDMGCGPNPAATGQAVSCTATVSPASSSGAVSFADGGTVIGTVPVSDAGTATLTTSTLTVGTHSLVASYGGNPTSGASSSSPVALVVNGP